MQVDNKNTNLYLLVKNPFTQRDYERMGVAFLEKNFNVFILDCSSWLMPITESTREGGVSLGNVIPIRSYFDLTKIKFSCCDFAIDYVGQFSLSAIFLFHYLVRRGVKLVVVDSGACATPVTHVSSGNSFLGVLRMLKARSMRQLWSGFLRKSALFFLPDQSPDFALVSGTSWASFSRFVSAKNKIESHSFDYEKYLHVCQTSQSRFGRYAVYLDENTLHHEDDVELGIPRAVTEQNFVPARKDFFAKFENTFGMPVVIAGYPSNNKVRNEVFEFDGREVVYGDTPNLIRGASVVFAHSSTAMSFAVLWQKPIVFLTSGEIVNSWYHPWIEAPRRFLGAKIVNIDSPEFDNDFVSTCFDFDPVLYDKYKYTYIKSKGSRDVSMWDIFINYLKKINLRC